MSDNNYTDEIARLELDLDQARSDRNRYLGIIQKIVDEMPNCESEFTDEYLVKFCDKILGIIQDNVKVN